MLTIDHVAPSKQPSPSGQSRSESDSESDVYGTSRRRTTVKKNRRQLVPATSDSGPSHPEVRFSTRRAVKVSNYNEDDEDPFEEDNTEMLTPNYWPAGQAEDAPAIDAILNHRARPKTSKLLKYHTVHILTVEVNTTTVGRDDFEYHVCNHSPIVLSYHV